MLFPANFQKVLLTAILRTIHLEKDIQSQGSSIVPAGWKRAA
jgi:hypothetical protein